MDDPKEIYLPKIINMGVFDARLAFGNIKNTPIRKVSIFEIEIPIEDGGITYLDNDVFPISKDCMICAKPGQLRHTTLPFKCLYVHLLLKEGILFDYVAHTPGMFEISQKSRYINLFTSMIDAYCSPFPGSDVFIQSKLLELFYLIHKDTHLLINRGLPTGNIDNSVISKALSYMDSNYASKNTLDDVARHVNLSPIYFHKLFTVATGHTPYQYILNKRLRKAKNLLLLSSSPMSEIAMECGFSSQSYFQYVFKKEVGITPKQFKKNALDRYPKS